MAGYEVCGNKAAAGSVRIGARKLSWPSYLPDGQDMIDRKLLESETRAKWHRVREKAKGAYLNVVHMVGQDRSASVLSCSKLEISTAHPVEPG